MTFKKNDRKTREAARKGGLARTKQYKQNPNTNPLKQLWKDDRWRKKLIKQGKQALKERRANKEEFRKQCSEAGKNSRKYENMALNKLKEQYDKIYRPSDIFDRLVIKNGQITFIEIKKHPDQKLRPKQKEFKLFCQTNNFNWKRADCFKSKLDIPCGR